MPVVSSFCRSMIEKCLLSDVFGHLHNFMGILTYSYHPCDVFVSVFGGYCDKQWRRAFIAGVQFFKCYG